MTKRYTPHCTVMRSDVVEHLCGEVESAQECFFADLTFGGGGHSLAILERLPRSKIVAVDQDPDAWEHGKRLAHGRLFMEKINFINFRECLEGKYNFILREHGGLSGIIMDLGVSAHHLEASGRGMSFTEDAVLDMRMAIDDDVVRPAWELINRASEDELKSIIKVYGEEKFAERIARRIVMARKKDKMMTAKELEEIVFYSYPKAARNRRHHHPATKTFQALRIAVNNELEVLSDSIPMLYSVLKKSGRMGIISFHSLEDRIVKTRYKEICKNMGAKLPVKGPITPTKREIKDNYRARSAKLRVIEKGA